MLFFKQKQKTDELLPPPPPDLELELERELKSKPKFFDSPADTEKPNPFPEEDEFTSLIEDLEGKPDKISIKKDKVIDKKPAKSDKPQLKEIKLLKKKIARFGSAKKKIVKKTKGRSMKQMPDADLGEVDEGEELPEDLQENKVEAMGNLSEFDFGHIETAGKDWNVGFDKPKEVLEAEEEIKSAIDKMKIMEEKPSFFKKFFPKKQAMQESNIVKEATIPKPISAGSLPLIQGKINEARQLLMRLDLDGARASYTDIMKSYNSLKPEDQIKVYQDIKTLYFDRKNAEGFNK